MARSFFLILALGLALPGSALSADPPVNPSASPAPTPARDDAAREKKKDDGRRDGDRKGDNSRGGDEGEMSEKFKKKLEKMNPEERRHFIENWKRWNQMSDAEKQEFKKRAKDERNRVKAMIDGEITKLGLTLDSDQREAFAQRYHQERRGIEEQLHIEKDRKRKILTEAMLQKLKAEFSTGKSAPSATPEPAKSE
jgi:hypothetical protein